MRYKYYYYELHHMRLKNLGLPDFLDANKIPYELIVREKSDDGKLISAWVHFTIFSNSANMQFVEELATKYRCHPVITPEFTKTEMNQAKLLQVYPKRLSITITNGKDSFAGSCPRIDLTGNTIYRHERQVGTIAIAKEPSMKTSTALWASDTGYGELYTDYRVYELAASNNLSGIEFNNVLLKGGKYSDKLYQLTSKHLIKKEMIASGHREKIVKCPICGMEQFTISSDYQLHLIDSNILDDSDLYVTERIFGDGIAEPLYIISQRFYQLLKRNKLAGNVRFVPVAVIS